MVDNHGCRFEPHISILRVGQTLVVKNSDPVGHNTKADAFKNTSFNDLIPAGGEIKKIWDQAEVLPVKIGCSIHTWMGGYVLVRANPYAAVTDADVDILLAASDFYAAAAQSDCRLETESPLDPPRLVAKGRSHECVLLEPLFVRLFSPSLPADGPEPTAFLMRRPEGGRAFLAARSFEMISLPLAEFRLFPRGLRARLAARGLAALRFEGGKRMQVLMNLGVVEPGAGDGGAASRSS